MAHRVSSRAKVSLCLSELKVSLSVSLSLCLSVSLSLCLSVSVSVSLSLSLSIYIYIVQNYYSRDKNHDYDLAVLSTMQGCEVNNILVMPLVRYY